MTSPLRLPAQALRGQWGFTGYITSDSDAVNCIFAQHHYVATGQEASCVAIVNGTCDINSGNVRPCLRMR